MSDLLETIGDFIELCLALVILTLLVFLALAFIGMLISVPIGVAVVLLKFFGVL